MSKSNDTLLCSLHINAQAFADLIAGRADKRTQVGILRTPDGKIAGNLFVAFDRETGEASTAKSGSYRLNVRRAQTKAQRASKALDSVLQSRASQVEAEMAGRDADDDIVDADFTVG